MDGKSEDLSERERTMGGSGVKRKNKGFEELTPLNSSTDIGLTSDQDNVFMNMRELAFERAAAMVASWPHLLLNKYHVEEMATHRPYLGVSLFYIRDVIVLCRVYSRIGVLVFICF